MRKTNISKTTGLTLIIRNINICPKYLIKWKLVYLFNSNLLVYFSGYNT